VICGRVNRKALLHCAKSNRCGKRKEEGFAQKLGLSDPRSPPDPLRTTQDCRMRRPASGQPPWRVFHVGGHNGVGNMRANGVRSLDVCCWLCHHRTILSADPWPDHVPVPAFGPRMVCHHNGRLAPRPPHGAGQHSPPALRPPRPRRMRLPSDRRGAIGVIRGGKITPLCCGQPRLQWGRPSPGWDCY
jgi:hypothetical protein